MNWLILDGYLARATGYRQLESFKVSVWRKELAVFSMKHTSTCSLLALICGFNFSKFALGGIIPFSKMDIHFKIPARPLPPSRWPILDLMEPLDLY